jgi:hypothetical protein
MTWFHLRRVCLQKVGQPFFLEDHGQSAPSITPIISKFGPLFLSNPQPPQWALTWEHIGCQMHLRFSAFAMQSRVWGGRVGGAGQIYRKYRNKRKNMKKHNWQTCTDVCFGLVNGCQPDLTSTPLCTLQAVGLCVWRPCPGSKSPSIGWRLHISNTF